MKKTARFVIWICSKFTREEIEQIIQGLLDVLVSRNPDVKPKDDFKEKHPNYRNFFVDPNPPLKSLPQTAPTMDWQELLAIYERNIGVRSALHSHKCILVIGIRLAIFVLIVIAHSTFGKSERRSLSINVAMTDVHVS